MRLWSLHPRHLDRIGLVACWRESLLAQAVLAGQTKGYRNHPQLERFRAQSDPLSAVGAYLVGLADDATARGYRFDRAKILQPQPTTAALEVTDGQIDYEWTWLGDKLTARSPDDADRWRDGIPSPHPLFTVIPGPIATWERGERPS